MKRAFTLVELLVVMGIIAVLAGIGIPVAGIVRAKAKETKCRHHLVEVFKGIAAYRLEHQQSFPATLTILTRKTNTTDPEPVIAGADQVLVCPLDPSKGSDDTCGRNTSWDNPVGDLKRLHSPGSSYFFEASGKTLGSTEAAWAFEDGKRWSDVGSTWWEAKAYQLRKGNRGSTPFAESAFPVVRCFYHHPWSSARNSDATKKVLNLAWDGSLFWSIPYWEHQANPAIPLP